MDLRGTLKTWDEEKGHGYIRSDTGGKKLFAKREDFKDCTPKEGERYLYQKVIDAEGTLHARKIAQVQKTKPRPQAKRQLKRKRVHWKSLIPACLVLIGFFALFQYLVFDYIFPVGLLRVTGFLSALSFMLIAWDKRLAKRNRIRIPEGWMLGVNLLGGWPGSLVAQQLFRHKTRSSGFRILCLTCALLHIGLLSLLAAQPGYWYDGKLSEYLPALGNRIQSKTMQLFDSIRPDPSDER